MKRTHDLIGLMQCRPDIGGLIQDIHLRAKKRTGAATEVLNASSAALFAVFSKHSRVHRPIRQAALASGPNC